MRSVRCIGCDNKMERQSRDRPSHSGSTFTTIVKASGKKKAAKAEALPLAFRML